MAFNKKLMLVRGAKRETIVVSNGSNITSGGDDAIEVNIDATSMTRGEAAEMLTMFRDRIIQGPWPIA